MKIIYLFLSILLILGCTSKKNESPDPVAELPGVQRSILKVNNYLLKRNDDHIHGFLHRTGWDMQNTASGLFFMETKTGTGEIPETIRSVSIQCTLRLIGGYIITPERRKGPLTFSPGQGGVIAGIEEATGMMHPGSDATLIIPPHLAYGNFGDESLGVPPNAILLAELTLLAINE